MSNQTEINDMDLKQWSEFLQVTFRQEPHWPRIVFAVSSIIVFVISLIGNLLTCIVIYYDRTMHTATNYYLFYLAVSDIIVALTIIPEAQEYIFESYMFNGDLACKVHCFIVFTFWYNSILTMTALAIERYIAIWYPLLLNSKPVSKRVIKIIAIIGILSIMQTLPEMWTIQFIQTQKTKFCFTMPTAFARVVNGVVALISFVLPLIIMTFVYTMIAFKVNVMQIKVSGNKIFNHRDNRNKVNKLVSLTLSFLVCWLPVFVIRSIIFACNMEQLMRLAKWWALGFSIMSFNSWFSTVLNPLLFSLMSTKFRKSLKALWSGKFKTRHAKQLLANYPNT